MYYNTLTYIVDGQTAFVVDHVIVGQVGLEYIDKQYSRSINIPCNVNILTYTTRYIKNW